MRQCSIEGKTVIKENKEIINTINVNKNCQAKSVMLKIVAI